jgi:hypothetical protein
VNRGFNDISTEKMDPTKFKFGKLPQPRQGSTYSLMLRLPSIYNTYTSLAGGDGALQRLDAVLMDLGMQRENNRAEGNCAFFIYLFFSYFSTA